MRLLYNFVKNYIILINPISMINKRLLLGAVMCVAAATTVQAALTALHIHTTDHGIITLALDDKPQLTFNDDRSITVEVTANPESQPITLSFDDVENCEYGDKGDYTESVSLISDDQSRVCVTITSQTVEFSNLAREAKVEVYSLSGVQILSAPAKDGAFTLYRDRLQHGIYIVRAGKFTTKLSL